MAPSLFFMYRLSINPMNSTNEQNEQFHIKTFGCQMNVADSERMTALLGEQGMTSTDDAGSAQVIIINGCTVREKAVHKAVSALGEFHAFKKFGMNGKIE